jgi:hypothetical protein
MSIISATQEAEISKIMVGDQPGQKTPSKPIKLGVIAHDYRGMSVQARPREKCKTLLEK